MKCYKFHVYLRKNGRYFSTLWVEAKTLKDATKIARESTCGELGRKSGLYPQYAHSYYKIG